MTVRHLRPTRYWTGISVVVWDTDQWSLHLGLFNPTVWVFGRATSRHDLCMEYFGFGPLFLLCADPGWWWGTWRITRRTKYDSYVPDRQPSWLWRLCEKLRLPDGWHG
jgi:hypothetical protein